MVAVRKDHAGLEIPRIIPRAGQRRDLALGQLGCEALQPDVEKTHRGHRAAQFHPATRRCSQLGEGLFLKPRMVKCSFFCSSSASATICVNDKPKASAMP